MKEKKNLYGLFLFCLALLPVFVLRLDVNAADTKMVPYVTQAKLISNQDIELYWSEAVTGADEQENFSVTVDGKVNPIYSYTWEEYNYTEKGIVYYSPKSQEYPNNPDTPKTSIRLTYPISNLSDLPDIKVEIAADKISNKTGNCAAEQTVAVTEYDAFYQQEITLDCGVKIVGTKQVRSEAMTKAKEMLEVILANSVIAERMGNAGCMLGIFGEGEIAYDILEHRYTYEEAYLYVEGFGGTQLASIKDANVLRLREGNYQTTYPNESILVHEFGHTVQNYGLSEAQMQEWESIYNSSIAAGKWQDSYAGSNSSEYFATLSAIWFNAMDDTADGQWDGVRGPVNTRRELKVYDEAAYNFLSEIYVSDQYLPAPWENGSVPDNYTISGVSPENDPAAAPGTDPEKDPVADPGTDTEKDPVKNPVTDPAAEQQTDPAAGQQTQQQPQKKITVKKASFSSVKALKGRKVSVTVKKVSGADGYKITYATNAKFKKGVKTKYIKGRKLTIKKLKKGTYYFKVQAYKLDSAGKKVLGKAGKVRKVNVKR